VAGGRRPPLSFLPVASRLPFEQIGEDEVDVLVEAELRVRRFGAWQGVPAFTQFELFDAVRVRPR
jgi:hypothetical protein